MTPYQEWWRDWARWYPGNRPTGSGANSCRSSVL